MKKPRFTLVLVIIASLVLLGAIGWGTFAILRQLKPTALASLTGKNQSSQPAQQATGPDADRQRAEQLLKDGKLADAKAAYQAAATDYTANGNTAAAADATRQIAIIDAMIKSQPKTVVQPSKPHQAGTAK